MSCITAEAEINLKAYEIGDILRKELNLPECNADDNLLKPKEILALAEERMSLTPTPSESTVTVKDQLRTVRGHVRALPSSFWNNDTIRPNSSNDDLLTRILSKPTTAGGFACAIACRCLKPNVADTKSIASRGTGIIDNFTVLRSAGAYCTIDGEMESLVKLFRSERDAIKIGDATFLIQERSQPTPGQVVMRGKANKCEARFISLLTPKFCLVGFFRHAGPEAEEQILGLFEELRLEATK